jgi:TRAP transporter TAXI family solute receptor
MSHLERARSALRGRILANRLVAVAGLLLVALTIFLWFHADRPREHTLRMTAGDPLSHRHQLAVILCEEAAKHGLDIELIDTTGSQEALTKIANDELDIALALGDFDVPDEQIRQVAVLNGEALHLFVRPELREVGVAGLRGKTLSLSTPISSTHRAADRLLDFVGLQSGRDFIEKDYSHADLLHLNDDDLPDAIFAITSLPWVEVGESLVKQHGYRLMELPMADAVALRNPAVHDMVIPAFSYSIDPPVPDRPLHTIGQRLLIVANRTTPDAAIERLMRVLFESEFGRRARLPLLDPTAVETVREFPLHTGARRYLNRNQPLIRADSIDKLENLRSFIVSAGLAAFLFWRWHKRRNLIGFETYIDAVSEIELAALAMERKGPLDFALLRRLRGHLSEQKNEALERESEGTLSGDEQMNSFLAHVLDVRTYLDALLSREPITQAVTPATDPAFDRQAQEEII